MRPSVRAGTDRAAFVTRTLLPETVETNRLCLERLDLENPGALTLYEHLGRDAPDVEETTRYVTWEPQESPKEAHDFATRSASKWDDLEGAPYVVRPRAGERHAGEFAGTTGLWLDWERSTTTMGIWLRKPFWGRGYSGERADALLELAFGRLDFDLGRVGHLPENDQSRRAIEKYVDRHGGRLEGTFRNHVVMQSGEVRDVVNYSMSQAEWREAAGTETDVQFRDT